MADTVQLPERKCAWDKCDKVFIPKSENFVCCCLEHARNYYTEKFSKQFSVETAEARFWEMVDKTAPGGCWLWSGKQDKSGYGVLRIHPGQIAAHRFSWKLHNKKEIPDDTCIIQTCGNRLCCNPAHLRMAARKWTSSRNKK